MAIANRKKEAKRKGVQKERRARAKTNKITRLSGGELLRPFWWRRDDLVIGKRARNKTTSKWWWQVRLTRQTSQERRGVKTRQGHSTENCY